MSGTFTSQMGEESMAAQLNAMRDELVQRFKANEDEHERLRAATESVRSDFNDLSGRMGAVQLSLDSTTDQARALLATMIDDCRKALDGVRGESLLALHSAMAKHEADLRGLYDTLASQVRHDLLGVRAELDATQASLRQVGSAVAAAGSPAAPFVFLSGPAAVRDGFRS